VRVPAWPLPVQRSLLLALVFAGFLVPTSLIIGWFATNVYLRAVAWIGYSWMGMMFLLLVSTLVSEIIRLFGAGTDPERRTLLARGLSIGVAGVAATAGGIGIWRAIRPVGVKEVNITLSRLPAKANGYVIAQITDMHIGLAIKHNFVEDVVKKINAINPDIIVLTGDMVDGSVERLREHTASFAKLNAPQGVYFVTGNHEYYSGADEWITEFQRLGIRVLRNERLEIGPSNATFDLVGIDDWGAHNFGAHHGADLKRALNGRDNTRACVLLAHNPKAGEEAIERGVDLQLSGHTHGGQIWPFNFAVRLTTRWVQGLYSEGPTQIYVSPGTGYWGPPMRIGTEAEITKVVLHSNTVNIPA
jgi:uncharacterized protein